MNRLFVSFVSIVLGLSTTAATIDQIIVRQQWPWSTDVKVEYRISGVTAPVNVTLTAYDGSTPLTIPTSAISGDLYGVLKDGVGTIMIDPVKAFGTGSTVLPNFKVKLAVSDAPASVTEVIYRIYDLTDGSCQNVSRADILNGKMGAYETDFSKVGDGFTTSLSDVLVWTGVTNYPGVRTTKLVMRKIPAKGVTYSMGNASYGGPANVTFTRDYWIGVFEVTQTQMLYMRPSQEFTEKIDAEERAASTISWNHARGYSTENLNYPNVGVFEDHDKTAMANDSALYGLQTLLGKTGFDLPTEAQWEYACRAGTSGETLNSGKSETSANLAEVARVNGINCTGSGFATATTDLSYGANIPGQYKETLKNKCFKAIASPSHDLIYCTA